MCEAAVFHIVSKHYVQSSLCEALTSVHLRRLLEDTLTSQIVREALIL